MCMRKTRVLFIGITCGLSAPYVAGQLHYCLQNLDVFTPVLLGFNPCDMARLVHYLYRHHMWTVCSICSGPAALLSTEPGCVHTCTVGIQSLWHGKVGSLSVSASHVDCLLHMWLDNCTTVYRTWMFSQLYCLDSIPVKWQGWSVINKIHTLPA